MKYTLSLCFAMFAVLCLSAQGDISKSKTLDIKSKKLDIKSSNKGAPLKIPSVFDKKKTSFSLSPKKKEVHMLPQKKLVRAGHDLKIDPRIGEKEKKGSDKHFGDQYLGDVKTGGKFVGVVARDHEFVDGDRVKVYVNGRVVEPNILLTAVFKGVNVDLDEGFNRIVFEALNQGSSGPNTAQVNAYDDKGQLIYSNKWNLSTGSKATLIVVKNKSESEDESE